MVTGSRAEEVVPSYPQSEENYKKAVEALKTRFGKEKLLTQVYVRELLKMVINNNTGTKTNFKASQIYDKLESHIRALESLGVTTEQMARFLYPMVESSLSEELLVAWQRSPLHGKDGSTENPPLSELDLEFLKRKVENEEQRELVQAGFVNQRPKEKSKQPSKSKLTTNTKRHIQREDLGGS